MRERGVSVAQLQVHSELIVTGVMIVLDRGVFDGAVSGSSFRVSVSSASRWLQRLQQEGHVALPSVLQPGFSNRSSKCSQS